MNIALFCPNYPPSSSEGGVSHYTQQIAHYLRDLGNEIFIFTDEGYLGGGSDRNVHILRFSKKWSFKSAKNIFANLESLRVDIVNLQYAPSMYPQSFKLTWPYIVKGFPSTISLHTLWGGAKLNYFFAWNLLCSTAGIIATNSEIVYLLKKYFPFFLKKTCHIPIGSNIKSIMPEKSDEKKVKAKFSIRPNEAILVYFGMAYPGKGMRILFETAKILKYKYNLHFKLLVIGGGISDVPEYLQEIKRLVYDLGISENVFFTGTIPSNEVSELLSVSDVVVLPFASGVSDRRGSLMAALTHNKAIVTTKPALKIDQFKNNVNMVWADRASAENIAEKVKHVLQDSIFRRKLEDGAEALAWNYRWEDIAVRTEKFFQTMILSKKLSRRWHQGEKADHTAA